MEYLALGNPTIDEFGPGSLSVGGSVVYSGVQASRLGRPARILGRGNRRDLDAAAPGLAREVELDIQDAPTLTRFGYEGPERRPTRLLACPAPIAIPERLPRARILHLAPVAQDFDLAAAVAAADAPLVGITPQGLLRRTGDDGRLFHGPIDVEPGVAGRIDVVIVSDSELEAAAALVDGVLAGGGTAVVTRGAGGSEVIGPAGSLTVPARPPSVVVDDVGAGDVFAAALLVELEDGRDPGAAARFAAAAAGLSIGGAGVSAIGSRAAIAAHAQDTDSLS
jgi:hypothetical protein